MKRACLAAAVSMLPVSQAALADVSISGWINEDIIYYDDGQGSDIFQASGNDTTLGSRITFAGSTDLPAGLSAGFEVITEYNDAAGRSLAFTQATASDNTGLLQSVNFLGHSVYLSGAFGKVTVGLLTTPTDNIAVLGDPSLTLWSSNGVVFRGPGMVIRNATDASIAGSTWGTFLQCQTLGGAGIGLDCNGIYRNGVRYDLPTFIDNVTLAVGWSNDDIYDVAGTWSGDLGRLKANLRLGYTENSGVNTATYDSTSLFQAQGGLMDPVTGLFGTVAYQNEDADKRTGALATASGDSDVYWLKVGIKKAFNSLGDTAIAFQYGSYNDQYGATAGVTDSEVTRIGFSVDQYFGSSLILYGSYENFSLDATTTTVGTEGDDLDMFTLGLTYFF